MATQKAVSNRRTASRKPIPALMSLLSVALSSVMVKWNSVYTIPRKNTTTKN